MLCRQCHFDCTNCHQSQNSVSGLVPPVYESLELQAERVMYQLRTFATTPLQKYDQLAQLAATNLTLYYKVLIDNLVELAPIVYTPTVGEACQKFDLLYRVPLGMVCECGWVSICTLDTHTHTHTHTHTYTVFQCLSTS